MVDVCYTWFFLVICSVTLMGGEPIIVPSKNVEGHDVYRVTWSQATTDLSTEKDPCIKFVIKGQTGDQHKFRFDFHPGAASLGQEYVHFTFDLPVPDTSGDLALALVDCRDNILNQMTTPFRLTTEQQVSGYLTWPQTPVGVHINIPIEKIYVGKLPVTVLVAGEGIAGVRVFLDGERVAHLTERPFKTRVKLGSEPSRHELAAEALNGDGDVVARDIEVLNMGPHAFSVALRQPLPEVTYDAEVTAMAELELPGDDAFSDLAFFLDDEKVATFRQPPFSASLALPEGKGPFHIRAVATLESGRRAEDSVLFNTPENFQELEVRHVRLWVGVRNRKGKPEPGLSEELFQVFEEGQRVHLSEFSETADVPLNVGFLVDISESMIRGMPGFAARSRTFLDIMEPGDKSAIFLFHETPIMVQPLTAKKEEMIAGMSRIEGEMGNTGLYGTGIYQSVVQVANYFGGAHGRRALIVYTDGNDTSSSINYPHAIRFLQQSGVQIFVIVSPLNHGKIESKGGLKRLAEETGGAYFQASFPAALEKAFDSIAEILRSQYMIGFQTTPTQKDECRNIKIKMPKGLYARHAKRICPE